MRSRVIISDTSCLIALEKIDRLDLLKDVYDVITITPEVAQEFGSDLPSWIEIQPVQDELKTAILELELDKGEASSIALAYENIGSLLIIDEKHGRAIARRMNIKFTGLMGVLVKAKRKGDLKLLKPILEELEKAGFRISNALILKVLSLVGE